MVEELIYGHLRKEQLVRRWEGDYGRRGGTLVIDITRATDERARSVSFQQAVRQTGRQEEAAESRLRALLNGKLRGQGVFRGEAS